MRQATSEISLLEQLKNTSDLNLRNIKRGKRTTIAGKAVDLSGHFKQTGFQGTHLSHLGLHHIAIRSTSTKGISGQFSLIAPISLQATGSEEFETILNSTNGSTSINASGYSIDNGLFIVDKVFT